MPKHVFEIASEVQHVERDLLHIIWHVQVDEGDPIMVVSWRYQHLRWKSSGYKSSDLPATNQQFSSLWDKVFNQFKMGKKCVHWLQIYCIRMAKFCVSKSKFMLKQNWSIITFICFCRKYCALIWVEVL